MYILRYLEKNGLRLTKFIFEKLKIKIVIVHSICGERVLSQWSYNWCVSSYKQYISRSLTHYLPAQILLAVISTSLSVLILNFTVNSEKNCSESVQSYFTIIVCTTCFCNFVLNSQHNSNYVLKAHMHCQLFLWSTSLFPGYLW